MTVAELEPGIDVENGMWGYQAFPDLAQKKQNVKRYISPKNTNIATVSSEDYGEQINRDKESPFETIEETINEHERIIKFLKSDLYKGRDDLEGAVTPRLRELINDIDEDDDKEESSISFLSFKNFIYFLVKNINVAVPSFVVTYQGNIRALWRQSRKQHLAVEFHPDETVTYVIFAPNAFRPEKIMRSSGTIDQRILYRVAVSLGAENWVCKNE